MKLLFPVMGMLLLVSCNSAQKDMCENHVSAKTPLCSELFHAFQAALVKSDTNLFNLRKIFFPSSEATPVLLNISYTIDFGNITDIPCTNDTSNAINASETFHKNYGWTSTVMYTVFHPATINRFQPQLFYEMMKYFESSNSVDAQAAAFYWEGVGSYFTLELSMYVQSLSCSPSYEQVSSSLKDMTAVLKTYAMDQGNLIEWKDTGAYVLDGRVFAHNWWNHEYEVYGIGSQLRLINWILAILITIALSVAFSVVIYQAPKKNEKHFKFHHSLLWSSTGALFLLWIISYSTEIAKIHMWRNNSTQIELGLNVTWLILIVLFIPTCSCCFSYYIDHDILSPSLAIFSSVCCGCCLCNCSEILDDDEEPTREEPTRDEPTRDEPTRDKPTRDEPTRDEPTRDEPTRDKPTHDRCRHSVIGACPLVVFFFSTGYIIINIVPVMFYFLIYSIRVVSFYSFILTAFVLYIFVVTAVEFERKKDKQAMKKDRQAMNVEKKGKQNHKEKAAYLFKETMRIVRGASVYPCLPFFTLVFIILLSMVFLTIYRTLVSGGSAGNNASSLFKALIPTLILGSPAIWLGKKLKKHYLQDENNTATQSTNTPLPPEQQDTNF